MSSQRLSTPGPPPAVQRRRRLISIAAVLLSAGGAAALADRVGSSASPAPRVPSAESLEIVAGSRSVLRVKLRRGQPPDGDALKRLLSARLTRRIVASRGTARISYRYDIDATVRRAVLLGAEGGRVQAVRERVSSRILVPVVRQAQRNTCESAALEVLLASTGIRVSQQRLQAAFPRSGSPDPQGTGPERIWGDPDLGYVGRTDGGGVAGGFGVYPGPVAATARKYARRLDDLTASTPQRIYDRVLAGRAVMVWIGLSDGPIGTWRSPQGKRIEVNFGEHTVVLTGITPNGDLQVVNPLQGTLEQWSRARFEAAWRLLDRRALGA